MNPAQSITIRGIKVNFMKRGDGRYKVYWREGGKKGSTTAATLKKAEEVARKTAKRLSDLQGSRIMTLEDVELVKRIKTVAMDRSPFAVLSQIEDAVSRLGSWEHLERAIAYYDNAGMTSVERVYFKHARKRFLDLYDNKSTWTEAGLRKELEAFEKGRETMAVCDITEDLLKRWIGRGKAKGRYFNNRLASWKTFLNKCRSWNYWPKGEKHPGETIARDPEPDKVPAIWTPEQADAILKVLPQNRLPYVVIGCWLGLRPISELMVIRWEHFDWEAGYLHVPPSVARKTMRERFIPIEPNVAKMLSPWKDAKGLCCRAKDREEISKILKKAGIIERWEQDVMRHSYISYQLAKGVGIGQVAEWAGNSEAKIRKNYRRPLKRPEGTLWFDQHVQ